MKRDYPARAVTQRTAAGGPGSASTAAGGPVSASTAAGGSGSASTAAGGSGSASTSVGDAKTLKCFYLGIYWIVILD
jgi:hypothetical protein